MTRSTRTARPFSPLDGLQPSSMTRDATSAHHAPPQENNTGPRSHHCQRETTLRARLTAKDKLQVEALCLRLSESLRTTVRPSNLLRSVMLLLCNTEASLYTEARRVHGLQRPRSDDRQAMVSFESALAEVVKQGIVDSAT